MQHEKSFRIIPFFVASRANNFENAILGQTKGGLLSELVFSTLHTGHAIDTVQYSIQCLLQCVTVKDGETTSPIFRREGRGGMREQVVVAVLCCACLSFRSGRYIPNFGLERRFMAAVSLPPLRAPSYHAAAFLYCSSINKMKVRRLLFSVLQRFATSTSTVSN